MCAYKYMYIIYNIPTFYLNKTNDVLFINKEACKNVR